jgi:hypothetical protein
MDGSDIEQEQKIPMFFHSRVSNFLTGSRGVIDKDIIVQGSLVEQYPTLWTSVEIGFLL